MLVLAALLALTPSPAVSQLLQPGPPPPAPGPPPAPAAAGGSSLVLAGHGACRYKGQRTPLVCHHGMAEAECKAQCLQTPSCGALDWDPAGKTPACCLWQRVGEDVHASPDSCGGPAGTVHVCDCFKRSPLPLPPAPPPPFDNCSKPLDCQLNGVCASNGTCACDPQWRGDRCQMLNLLPARPDAGLQLHGQSSWGGSIIRDAAGLYHMFASVMANACGLGGWLPNSQIGRATSPAADGPYELQEIIVPRFAHEPEIVTAPDGTYVIYLMGSGLNASDDQDKNCSDGCTGKLNWRPGTSFFGAAGGHGFAESFEGPWHFSPHAAYGNDVVLTNGSTVTLRQRERPKLFLTPDGQPHYLVNGAGWRGDCDRTFTLVQPIAQRALKSDDKTNDDDFQPYPGPAWMRPRVHYAPLNKSAGDIAAALSHNGLHHVWQLTQEDLGDGAGWHHRVSRDLVRWRAASHTDPVGPNDWPSGFAVADDEQTAGRICAGMRCDRCKPDDPAKPLCELGKDNTSACQQPPLALRCATNDAATVWGSYEPMFPVTYYRGLPYDPFRPFRDHDGRWYAGIAIDACNGTTNSLPCPAGGAIAVWSSPTLRGPQADWQLEPELLFTNNHSIYPGPMSQHGQAELVTIDFFGALPGDSSAEWRVIFNNCYDCRGATEYFIGKQSNGAKFEIEYSEDTHSMLDWSEFTPNTSAPMHARGVDVLSRKSPRPTGGRLCMTRTLGDFASTNQVAVSGRRVAIGSTSGMCGFNISTPCTSMQSLARDLSLQVDSVAHPILMQAFVPELQTLRQNHTVHATAAWGQQLELYVVFVAPSGAMSADAAPFGISVLRSSDGSEETTVGVHPRLGLVCINGSLQGNPEPRCAPWRGHGANEAAFHLIVDHSILELIVSNVTAITASVAPSSVSAGGVALYGTQNESGSAGNTGVAAMSVDVWTLADANNQPRHLKSDDDDGDAGSALRDPRNVSNGLRIFPPLVSSNSSHMTYQDQPQTLVLQDGSWFVVWTHGIGGTEGAGLGNRVLSARSTSQGVHWSSPVDVEPLAVSSKTSASWANPVLFEGRIYVFYTFNCKNLTNQNQQGCWVFRRSDDGGRSFSARQWNYTAAIDDHLRFDIDRQNRYAGKILAGWATGKPLVATDGSVWMQFSKVGGKGNEISQGVFLRSPNLTAFAADPLAPVNAWELTPKTGSVGLRSVCSGPASEVSEEGNLVEIDSARGQMYGVSRSTCGWITAWHTEHQGFSWSAPGHAEHDRSGLAPPQFQSPGLKNPRGPLCPRRLEANRTRYLMLYYNTGGPRSSAPWATVQSSPLFGDYCARTIYWLSAGRVQAVGTNASTVVWSQPEVVLYNRDSTATDPNLYVSTSYPDIIQQGGKIWIAETDKEVARTHLVDRSLVDMLLQQSTVNGPVTDALLLDWNVSSAASRELTVPAGLWSDPIAGPHGDASFSIELTLAPTLKPSGLPATPPGNASFRLVRNNSAPVDFVVAALGEVDQSPWIVKIPDDGTAATGCRSPAKPAQPGHPTGNTCVVHLSLTECANRCGANPRCRYFWYYYPTPPEDGRCCPKQSYDLAKGWVNFTSQMGLGGWYAMGETEEENVGADATEKNEAPVWPAARDALLDCRDNSGKGVAIFAPQAGPSSGGRAQPMLLLNGAQSSQRASADSDAWHTHKGFANHLTVVVDGAAQIILFLVNGVLSDGGDERSQGWASIDQSLGSVSGAERCVVGAGVEGIRMYNRTLRTTEAVGMWRHESTSRDRQPTAY